MSSTAGLRPGSLEAEVHRLQAKVHRVGKRASAQAKRAHYWRERALAAESLRSRASSDIARIDVCAACGSEFQQPRKLGRPWRRCDGCRHVEEARAR